MEEWINEMWYMHTVGFYSALKRSKVLTRAAAWMTPENMLNERSQTQKATCYMILLICIVQNRCIRKDIAGCWLLGIEGEENSRAELVWSFILGRWKCRTRQGMIAQCCECTEWH